MYGWTCKRTVGCCADESSGKVLLFPEVPRVCRTMAIRRARAIGVGHSRGPFRHGSGIYRRGKEPSRMGTQGEREEIPEIGGTSLCGL